MVFWNLFKKRRQAEDSLRKIKTLRGQKKIDKAIEKGYKLLFRKVEPFSDVRGKYRVVQHIKTGKKTKLYDFRDSKCWSSEYQLVEDWNYIYYSYDFPPEAAYIVPNDIQEGEMVLINDVIENLLGYYYNQGSTKRLKSCKAVWTNDDLQLLYNPNTDCVIVVG